MSKTFWKLFLTNLAVVLIGFFLLGIRLKILEGSYGSLIFFGTAIALGLTIIINKVFLKSIQQIEEAAQKNEPGGFQKSFVDSPAG